MTQHDFVIDNQSFPAFRADLNQGLSALATTNSGDSEPPNVMPYMYWADTSNNLLKQRNAANDGWITIRPLDSEFRFYTTEITQVISNGVIDVTNRSRIAVRNESDASSDYLQNITGGVTGQEITIRPQSSAQHIIVRGGGGNIRLKEGGSNFRLFGTRSYLTLVYDGGFWLEKNRTTVSLLNLVVSISGGNLDLRDYLYASIDGVNLIYVSPENGADIDNLDTITRLPQGTMILLRIVNPSTTVKARNNRTGSGDSIYMGGDIRMNSMEDALLLYSTGTSFCKVAWSNNS